MQTTNYEPKLYTTQATTKRWQRLSRTLKHIHRINVKKKIKHKRQTKRFASICRGFVRKYTEFQLLSDQNCHGRGVRRRRMDGTASQRRCWRWGEEYIFLLWASGRLSTWILSGVILICASTKTFASIGWWWGRADGESTGGAGRMSNEIFHSRLHYGAGNIHATEKVCVHSDRIYTQCIHVQVCVYMHMPYTNTRTSFTRAFLSTPLPLFSVIVWFFVADFCSY